MGLLDSKVALISGTGRGQGRDAALIFTAEGARVLGCDVSGEDSEETLRLVKAQGGEMESLHPLDVSDPNAALRWTQHALARWGRIDVLYNNAGSLRALGPFAESTLDEWEQTLRYELTIVYVPTKAVWPTMVAQHGGVIINTASIQGRVEALSIRTSAHGATKAGVIAFTRMLAAEGASHQIRAVSISPGFIDSPVTIRRSPTEQRTRAKTLSKVPLGRAGSCAEVAHVAAFLASERASYVNGTDIVVDGGFTGVSYPGCMSDDSD